MNKKDEIIQKTMNLSVMDKEGNEALDKLAGELTVKDMLIFQPIVEMTNEVADILNIKYGSGSDDEIQAYKDGKKTYGAFNSKLAEAKRDLKAPYTETIKAIDTVFRKFSEVYALAKDHLALEFKPYTDEQQRLKEEREKKKNEAREKELAALKEQNAIIVQKNENARVYNAVQYDIIANYKTKAIENLNGLNADTIEQRIDKYLRIELATAIYDSDVKVDLNDFNQLEKVQKDELVESFTKAKMSTVELYRTRLKELVELQNMRIREANKQEEDAIVPVPAHEIPKAPSIPNDVFNTENFIQRQTDLIMEVRDNCDYYHDLEGVEDRLLAKNISLMLSKALEFINLKVKQK